MFSKKKERQRLEKMSSIAIKRRLEKRGRLLLLDNIRGDIVCLIGVLRHAKVGDEKRIAKGGWSAGYGGWGLCWGRGR